MVCPFPEPGRGCAHSTLSGAHLSSSARDHLQMRRPQLRRPILLPGVTVVSPPRDQDLHPTQVCSPSPCPWSGPGSFSSTHKVSLLLYSSGLLKTFSLFLDLVWFFAQRVRALPFVAVCFQDEPQSLRAGQGQQEALRPPSFSVWNHVTASGSLNPHLLASPPLVVAPSCCLLTWHLRMRDHHLSWQHILYLNSFDF